ncbi:MAG: prepilin peptidase [Chloroflexi bacterium]|nr:prepilin peptidase [Chloroflexota bacterium]
MGVAAVVLLAVLGAVVGSFLNVCIDRLPLKLSLLRPGSHCSSCLHPLAPLDLVPIFSYLWLRGRCRYCRVRISWRLPVVEAVTGALFAFIGVRYGVGPKGLVLLAYASLLVAVFFIDLEHRLVLDRLVYPGAAVALILAPWAPPGAEAGVLAGYLASLEGGGVALGVFLVVYLASRGGMGAGDVKLAALVGLMLGLRLTLVALPISFMVGGLAGVLMLALRLKGRRDPVPFGPFLSGATVVAIFWGGPILEWYQGLVGIV